MNILFFASLREQLNTDAEYWENLDGLNTAEDLLDKIKARGEPWLSALSNPQLIISINQEVSDISSPIKRGDEVAFFPPVTGG